MVYLHQLSFSKADPQAILGATIKADGLNYRLSCLLAGLMQGKLRVYDLSKPYSLPARYFPLTRKTLF